MPFGFFVRWIDPFLGAMPGLHGAEISAPFFLSLGCLEQWQQYTTRVTLEEYPGSQELALG